MKNPLKYTPTGVVDSVPAPRIPQHKPFVPTEEVEREPIVVTQMPSRCIGCRWHMPKEIGGEGFLCHQTDGRCPSNIVQWVLRYSLNKNGKPRKSFANDEELLEALRL